MRPLLTYKYWYSEYGIKWKQRKKVSYVSEGILSCLITTQVPAPEVLTDTGFAQ